MARGCCANDDVDRRSNSTGFAHPTRCSPRPWRSADRDDGADRCAARGGQRSHQRAPIVTRIVVVGSETGNEWLKLSVDPRSHEFFAWELIDF
jgi:hypothetical protein